MGDLPIEVAAGLLVGAGLGLVGAGGAIFAVPMFATALGHPAPAAAVEAMAVTGAVALSSGMVAAVRGLADWRRVAWFGAAGLVGAQAAAPLAVRIPPGVQVALFTVVAALAAWRMWASGGADARDAGIPPRGSRIRSASIGFGIGILTSILGVGGGFLLVPPLVVLEGLPMRRAVATGLLVIAINCAAGLAGRWWTGGFQDIEFHSRSVAIVAACGIVGSLAGAAVQGMLPQRELRRTFAVLLATVAAVMAVRAAAH